MKSRNEIELILFYDGISSKSGHAPELKIL